MQTMNKEDVESLMAMLLDRAKEICHSPRPVDF